MTTETTSAWVIHKRWSGDTSARVTFFTPHNGLVCGLYQGGRSPKKQALLQAFLPLWLAFDVRGEWYYVQKLEIAAPPLPLVGKNLFAGLYVNELIHHTQLPLDPHKTLFTAYTDTLQGLSKALHAPALEATLRRFERALLLSLGYDISLMQEAHTLMPILADKHYQFSAGEGLVRTDGGILGADILAFAEDKLDEASVLKAAKHIMRGAIRHALDGKPLKSRELYLA